MNNNTSLIANIITKNKTTLNTIIRQKNSAINPCSLLAEEYRKVIDGGPFPTIPKYPSNSNIQRINGTTFKKELKKTFTCLDNNFNTEAKVLCWTKKSVALYNKSIREFYTSSPFPLVGEVLIANNTIKVAPNPWGSKCILASNGEYLTVTNSLGNSIHYDGVTYTHLIVATLPSNLKSKAHGTINFVLDPTELVVALAKEREVSIECGNWRKYYAIKDAYADVQYTYAGTIHKSQGSTYKKVFINLNDIAKNNNAIEVARLMYVAITRASEQVFLYGKLGERYGDP